MGWEELSGDDLNAEDNLSVHEEGRPSLSRQDVLTTPSTACSPPIGPDVMVGIGLERCWTSLSARRPAMTVRPLAIAPVLTEWLTLVGGVLTGLLLIPATEVAEMEEEEELVDGEFEAAGKSVWC